MIKNLILPFDTKVSILFHSLSKDPLAYLFIKKYIINSIYIGLHKLAVNQEKYTNLTSISLDIFDFIFSNGGSLDSNLEIQTFATEVLNSQVINLPYSILKNLTEEEKQELLIYTIKFFVTPQLIKELISKFFIEVIADNTQSSELETSLQLLESSTTESKNYYTAHLSPFASYSTKPYVLFANKIISTSFYFTSDLISSLIKDNAIIKYESSARVILLTFISINSTLTFCEDFISLNYKSFKSKNINLIINAYQQSSGIGRNNKSWITSTLSDLACTYIYHPDSLSSHHSQFMSLSVGNTLHKLLIGKGFSNTLIKWPNDIYIDSKKACGILVGKLKNFTFVSFGINILSKRAEVIKILNREVNSLLTIEQSQKVSNIDLINYQNVLLLNFYHLSLKELNKDFDQDYYNRNSYFTKGDTVIINDYAHKEEFLFKEINKLGFLVVEKEGLEKTFTVPSISITKK